MPDTTQMKAILERLSKCQCQFKGSTDMIKDNIEGYLKILHLLVIPNVQSMIKSSQIDQNV